MLKIFFVVTMLGVTVDFAGPAPDTEAHMAECVRRANIVQQLVIATARQFGGVMDNDGRILVQPENIGLGCYRMEDTPVIGEKFNE